MPKNFYNLPPPWNPGYAIPESVMSEGLQRHAFTTKWAPRGTYDNSTDGTAGYAIPKYVVAEGTGRGTFTTAWLPRGYYGPDLPNYLNRHPLPDSKVVVQKRPGMGDVAEYNILGSSLPKPQPVPPKAIRRALGDVSPAAVAKGSAALTKYGRRTSSIIMRKLAKVAPGQRDATFKMIADRIDPSLYNRTQAEADKAKAKGAPASAAFEIGLANAMQTGFLSELAQIGKHQKKPPRNSLLGMGLYEALGATLMTTVTATSTGVPKPQSGQRIQVGPFTFPVGDKPFVLADGVAAMAALPREWHGYISRALKLSDAEISALTQDLINKAVSGSSMAAAKAINMQIATSPDNKIWKEALHIFPGQRVTLRAISPMMTLGNWSDSDDGRAMPIATFTHPVSGNKWGVFLGMSGDKLKPTGVQLYVKWLPEKPWYSRALGWIASIPAKIIDAAKEVASAIGSAACDFLQTPGAAAGAAAASGGAAGIGVAIAAGVCGPGAPPVAPPVDTGPSLITTLAIGGGALLAIHLLTKKKATP